MLLKQKSGNVTIELIIFFLLIGTTIWLSIGIFEASKTRSTLNEISYLAARQIATNQTSLSIWQSSSTTKSFESSHGLQDLKIIIECENNICNNGKSIKVFAQAKSANGVYAFSMKSSATAVSSRYTSD